jgi:hypothetical protein
MELNGKHIYNQQVFKIQEIANCEIEIQHQEHCTKYVCERLGWA